MSKFIEVSSDFPKKILAQARYLGVLMSDLPWFALDQESVLAYRKAVSQAMCMTALIDKPCLSEFESILQDRSLIPCNFSHRDKEEGPIWGVCSGYFDFEDGWLSAITIEGRVMSLGAIVYDYRADPSGHFYCVTPHQAKKIWEARIGMRI